MRFNFYFSWEHLFIGARKCLSHWVDGEDERYTQHCYICPLPMFTVQISYEVDKPSKPTAITELY